MRSPTFIVPERVGLAENTWIVDAVTASIAALGLNPPDFASPLARSFASLWAAVPAHPLSLEMPNAPQLPAGCSHPIAVIGSATRGCASSRASATQSTLSLAMGES